MSVCFVDESTGWAVGQNGCIIKTTDGSANWSTQTSETTNLLESVCFVDESTGWAVGSNGCIIKTTDGGINWIR